MTAAGPAVENFCSALEPKPQINQAGGCPGEGWGAQISAHQSALPPALVRGMGGKVRGRQTESKCPNEPWFSSLTRHHHAHTVMGTGLASMGTWGTEWVWEEVTIQQ